MVSLGEFGERRGRRIVEGVGRRRVCSVRGVGSERRRGRRAPDETGCLGQQRSEPLHPPLHRDVIHLHAAFGEQLLDVAVGQVVAQVPAHRHHDHLWRKPEPRERRRRRRPPPGPDCRVYRSTVPDHPAHRHHSTRSLNARAPLAHFGRRPWWSEAYPKGLAVANDLHLVLMDRRRRTRFLSSDRKGPLFSVARRCSSSACPSSPMIVSRARSITCFSVS